MGKFLSGFSNSPTSTTAKTFMKIAGQSGKNFEVVYIYMGLAGASGPGDFQHQVNVGWINNATIGTPGSVTAPIRMSYAGPTSVLSVGVAYTAEPTAYDAFIPPLMGFNQRGGVQFSVPRGEGFITDPASAMGFGVRVLSNTPGNVDGAIMFWEP